MSAEKRVQVYELCKKYGVLIVEDNPYGELRYKGEDILPIKSLDTEGIVIYCGSFSKIFSAGIRIGYTFAPEPISRKIVLGKQVADVHSNTYSQVLIKTYMDKYDIDQHIKFIRGIYLRKSNLMLDSMAKYMHACEYQAPEGGLFIWCSLPQGTDSFDFSVAAAGQSVAVVPGNAFSIDQNAITNSFRLNYSTPTDDQIERGIKILGQVMDEKFSVKRA
jgi:2-aminoadipate transaminase